MGRSLGLSGDGTSTRVIVLDSANRAAPKVVRQFDLSGSLMVSRRIGNAVHTVVADADSPSASYQTWPPDLDTCGTRESVVPAKFVPAAGRPYGPNATLAVSTPGGAQVESQLNISLFQGNWWVGHNGNWLGYYPGKCVNLTNARGCEAAWYGGL